MPALTMFKIFQNLWSRLGVGEGKPFTNGEESNSNYCIGDEYWPVLYLSRLLGSCPVVKGDGSSKKPAGSIIPLRSSADSKCYRIYPKITLGVVCNIIIVSFFVGVSCLLIINACFQIPFLIPSMMGYGDFPKFRREGNETSMNGYRGTQIYFIKYLVKLCINLLSPITQILEIPLAWLSAGELVLFLNGWNEYSRLFEASFKTQSVFIEKCLRPKLHSFTTRLLVLYVALPSLCLCPPFLFIGYKVQGIQGICALSLALQLIPRAMLEDAKCLVAYKTLQIAFNGIWMGMDETIKSKGRVTPELVQSWGKVIRCTRRQCDVAGRIQSNIQLLGLFTSALTITVFVFALCHWKSLRDEAVNTAFLTLCVGQSLMLLGRIYFKVIMAELITSEEQKCLHILSNLEVGYESSDGMVHLQVQKISNLIQQSPIQISLGNYVWMRKPLMIGVASQVLTYLVVLMQINSGLV